MRIQRKGADFLLPFLYPNKDYESTNTFAGELIAYTSESHFNETGFIHRGGKIVLCVIPAKAGIQ